MATTKQPSNTHGISQAHIVFFTKSAKVYSSMQQRASVELLEKIEKNVKQWLQ